VAADRGSARRIAIAALLCTGLAFAVGGRLYTAMARNRCAIEQARTRAVCPLPESEHAISGADWPAFRSVLFAGEWERARGLAPRFMLKPARLGESLVIQEVSRRAAAGDSPAALSLLDLVLDSGSRDPLLWYATGRAYEVAGSLERAERCYLRGIDADREGAGSAGHYYLGVLYSKQGRWQHVVDTLEFLARGPISPAVESAAVCGLCARADWPAAVLLLADGYSRSGRTADAIELYRRFLLAAAGSREWQVNRALVALAALEGRGGAIAEAAQHFAAAIDLTLGYPDSFRGQYQADTWRQLLNLAGDGGAAANADALRRAATLATEQAPRSPGAWLLLALTGALSCRDDVSREALGRAEALDSGAAAFRGDLRAAEAGAQQSRCRTP
jgi:tetratricopeptide (TPR) repeat protein